MVVAFLDGRRVRGYVYNFSALRDAFSVFPQENSRKQDAVEIKMKDLKAIFFVKDFAGNREYQDDALPDLLKRGRKIEAAFSDGETLSERPKRITRRNPAFLCFLPTPKATTPAYLSSTKTSATSSSFENAPHAIGPLAGANRAAIDWRFGLLPRMLRSPWRLRFHRSIRHRHTGNIDQQGRKKARAQPSCKTSHGTALSFAGRARFGLVAIFNLDARSPSNVDCQIARTEMISLA